LSMRADMVVVPEVEGPTHGYSVAHTKQRPDVSCKTGGALLSGHDYAPLSRSRMSQVCGEAGRSARRISRPRKRSKRCARQAKRRPIAHTATTPVIAARSRTGSGVSPKNLYRNGTDRITP